MKKLIVSLFLALMVGMGLGLELPDESTVVVTDGSGAIVGFGAFEDGSLELSISEDASGFLLLTFTTEDGDVVTVEVMVSEEGTLVVTDSLTDLAAEAGGETEISFVSSEEIAAEVEDGLDVADDAAGENGAEGREVAREARDTRGQPDVSELPVDEEEGSEEEAEEGSEEEEEEEDSEEEEPEVEDDGSDVADEYVPTLPTAP